MRDYLLFALLLFVSSATWAIAADDVYLDFLLGIKAEKYKTRENGEIFFDDLAAMNDRDKVYVSTRQRLLSKNADDEDMRYFIFIGFTAYSRNAAATMEALSADMMSVYKNNTQAFLKSLSDLSFAVEASCYYLGNYFGFEGKHLQDKKAFEKRFKPEITVYLGPDDRTRCMARFHNP